MTQLWLFDELDQLEKPAEPVEWVDRRLPVTCSHCGETGMGDYWLKTNHGVVFNGWCAKRFHIGMRTHNWLLHWLGNAAKYGESFLNGYFADRQWLFEKGFDHLADPWDRETWPAGHVPYWENHDA